MAHLEGGAHAVHVACGVKRVVEACHVSVAIVGRRERRGTRTPLGLLDEMRLDRTLNGLGVDAIRGPKLLGMLKFVLIHINRENASSLHANKQ